MRRAAEAALVGCVLAIAPLAARADGAFPDSEGVLMPADRPQEIILATNFGLVISEDGGQSWQWSCEQDANSYGALYQYGPAPRDRLFAVGNSNLVFSDDGSCGWQTAGGAIASDLVIDFFPDATDANRVLAVVFGAGSYAILASQDGGVTFGTTLYQAENGDGIASVEIARADPQVIYVALSSADGHPKLARSSDGGGTWAATDLSPTLGEGVIRIVAVDEQDPNTLLLRLMATAGDAIVLTHDAGATLATSLSIPGTLTSYVQLPSGTRLVSAIVDGGTTPALFRSGDGGATFDAIDGPPHIRGLAQRGGLVYAATDNVADGYALARSDDEGTSWQAVMSYADVQAIIPCLRGNALCESTCATLAGATPASTGAIWADAVCTANPPPATDGGAIDGDAGGSAGNAGGAGCGGCSAVPENPRDAPALLILIGLSLELRLRSAPRPRRRWPARPA